MHRKDKHELHLIELAARKRAEAIRTAFPRPVGRAHDDARTERHHAHDAMHDIERGVDPEDAQD